MRQDDVLIIKFIDISEELAALSSFVMKRIQQTFETSVLTNNQWSDTSRFWQYRTKDNISNS